jgi:hypothetical protein
MTTIGKTHVFRFCFSLKGYNAGKTHFWGDNSGDKRLAIEFCMIEIT